MNDTAVVGGVNEIDDVVEIAVQLTQSSPCNRCALFQEVCTDTVSDIDVYCETQAEVANNNEHDSDQPGLPENLRWNNL